MTKIEPTENPYPEPVEHPVDSPELDEGDLHEAWNEGVEAEQKRMTRVLRELHKQGWTLSDVIEAENTMGED